MASAPIPIHAPKVQVGFELLGPAEAEKMLATMQSNRRLSQKRVDMLARDMVGGYWQSHNGQTIKLDQFGRLIDGEHRLRAVVQSGICIPMLIVRGVPSEARTTIDTGRARTFGDHLAMSGVVNANVVASAVAWLIRYETDAILSNEPLSHDELTATLRAHPGIVASAATVGASKVSAPPSVLTFVHYKASASHPQEADEFVTMVQRGAASDGSGLGETHPAFRLRERFLAERGRKTRLRRIDALALTIRAWNLFRAGRTVKVLKSWRADGPSAEPFPRLETER